MNVRFLPGLHQLLVERLPWQLVQSLLRRFGKTFVVPLVPELLRHVLLEVLDEVDRHVASTMLFLAYLLG